MEGNALRIGHPKNGSTLSVNPGEITKFKLEALNSAPYEVNFSKSELTNLERSPKMDKFAKVLLENDFKETHLRYIIDFAKTILH